ncbi:MAG: Uma2 family endonuclease [Burkholderiales bacterium]
MTTSVAKSKLSFDEFVLWEASQPDRHELVNGEAFAMTGGSTAHGAVGLTILSLLKSHLANSRCRVFWPDVKLRVDKDAFYPDVKVSCHPAGLVNTQFIEHPVLIVEILSLGTEDYDRGRKFDAYRRIAVLQEYLLIDPETRAIELRRRAGPSQWEFLDLSQDETLRLESVGFQCSAESVFADLPPSGASN